MSYFPQVSSGSIAQFPLRRLRKWRSIENRLESNESIAMPDPSAGEIEWNFSMKDLSDPEAHSITDLFSLANGQFGAFLFVDPLANLLGWSENLSRPDWQAGLLNVITGAADPIGSQRASLLVNPSAGTQALQQTVALPGEYVACFSAWVSSDVSSWVTLARGTKEVTVPVGPVWKRVYITGKGERGATESAFSMLLDAGQSINVWGMQVEAQPYPSEYKQTRSAMGIYDQTYFANDELTMTITGVGLSSCEIALKSRV